MKLMSGGAAMLAVVGFYFLLPRLGVGTVHVACDASTQKQAASYLKSTLTGQPIKVLESYNARPNPMFNIMKDSMGKEPNNQYAQALLTEQGTERCMGNIMTETGEMDLYFGWKDVNGTTYITARAVPAGLSALLNNLKN